MTNAPAPAPTDAAPTTTPDQPAPGAPDTEPTTFDADYVKALRTEAAKYRTEAKANADAAKRLAEIEESQKTEAQKAADRLAKAESDAAQARTEALRYRIAARHNISDEDAETFLTGADEDAITRQAERLAALQKAGSGTPKPDKSQGDQGGKGAGTDMNALIRGSRRGA